MKKKIFSVLLVMCMFITNGAFAFAAEYENSEKNFHTDKSLSEIGVTVTVADKIRQEVPEFIIEDIFKDNPDAEGITIIDYKSLDKNNDTASLKSTPSLLDGNNDNASLPAAPSPLDENNNTTSLSAEPSRAGAGFFSYGPIKTTKTVTTSNQLAKDEFKFSVARGESVTLTRTYKGELTGSYSGSPIKAGDLNVTATITGEYSKGTHYECPSDASCNSREFRMKFYQDLGTYKQTQDTFYNMGGKKTVYSTETKTGTFKKATKFLSYSIDRNIS